MPVDEDVARVGLELDEEPSLAQLGRRPDELLAAARLTKDHEHPSVGGNPQAVAEAPPNLRLLVARLDRVGDRPAYPAAGLRIPIVVDDERSLARGAHVRVGKDVLVDATAVDFEVVQEEIADLRELGPPMEERHDLPVVAGDQPGVGPLVPGGATELHPVLLRESLDLAVPEHRQSGQGNKEGGHAEVLVALAELFDGGLLVRVGHEVHVALEDLGVEFKRVAHHQPVFGVALVAEHDHEGAVVDAVHAQGSDEVAFQQPEGLGQQERAGSLHGDSIDHLAPELIGHEGVELGLAHRMLGSRGDAAGAAGRRPPQPLDVLLGKHHCRVEADDRELAGHVEDGLDDGLADGGLEVVELGGVVPREARAVVAVIDIALVARPAVLPLEDDGCVGAVPVVVLEEDANPLVR